MSLARVVLSLQLLVMLIFPFGAVQGALAAPDLPPGLSAPPSLRAGQGDAALIGRLQGLAGPDLRVDYHPETGRVRFIGTDAADPIHVGPRVADAAAAPVSAESTARAFLAEYGSLFGIRDQGVELRLMRRSDAGDGRSFVRFQQVANGVPVLGGELIVQTDGQGGTISANGEALPEIAANPNPRVAAADAAGQALDATIRQYQEDGQSLRASTPELWYFNPAMLGGPGVRITRLVWRVDVEATDLSPIRELVLIDAVHGGVALRFNQIETAKDRRIYDNNNNPDLGLPGNGPVRIEGQEATGSQDVDLAYEYSGAVYDFYLNTHGRNSIDNAGMPLIQTVRYCRPGDPCPYANAFWNGSQMVYGDTYASADDVVAHEMTHGVTQHESNLFYYFQSGAINESFSDAWGEFIDLTDGVGDDSPAVRWLIGEDLPIHAIRNMADPTAFGDPDRIGSANYTCDTAFKDNGGVHYNSGVSNKAVYLMTDGGTFNGQTITGLGITKAAKILYEVQSNLFTSASDYGDYYNLAQQACTNLVGTAGIIAADCQQVKKALDATQMNQQPAGCAAAEAPVCPAGEVVTDLFSDNLENTASGNWTTGTISGPNTWYYPQTAYPDPGWETTYATSGVTNIYGDDTKVTSDSYIAQTNGVALPGGSTPFMRFNHSFQFESSGSSFYDGGVLEYSANSSAWQDAGALITENGYNGDIKAGSGNPLGGRQGFVGASSGYGSSRLTLTSLAGQSVQFRFRIGTDSSVGSWGWFIDDIRIYVCGPVITSLSPGGARPGATSFTLAVNGLGFVNGLSTVRWNGVNRTTTFVSPTRLQVTVNAGDIAAAGTADIIVLNGSSGGTSDTVRFVVGQPTFLPLLRR